MTRKINPADLPEFDLAEMLKTEQDIATYLTLVIEEGGVSELSRALDIASASGSLVDFMRSSPLHGVEDIAFERDTSLTRASPL